MVALELGDKKLREETCSVDQRDVRLDLQLLYRGIKMGGQKSETFDISFLFILSHLSQNEQKTDRKIFQICHIWFGANLAMLDGKSDSCGEDVC